MAQLLTLNSNRLLASRKYKSSVSTAGTSLAGIFNCSEILRQQVSSTRNLASRDPESGPIPVNLDVELGIALLLDGVKLMHS